MNLVFAKWIEQLTVVCPSAFVVVVVLPPPQLEATSPSATVSETSTTARAAVVLPSVTAGAYFHASRRSPRGCCGRGSRPPRPQRELQGKLTMLTGMVAAPCAAAPVSLTTWSITPTPPSETVRRSCSFTPGLTGTSKARVAWIVGLTLKKQ